MHYIYTASTHARPPTIRKVNPACLDATTNQTPQQLHKYTSSITTQHCCTAAPNHLPMLPPYPMLLPLPAEALWGWAPTSAAAGCMLAAAGARIRLRLDAAPTAATQHQHLPCQPPRPAATLAAAAALHAASTTLQLARWFDLGSNQRCCWLHPHSSRRQH
jgi:hypothetical protein